MAAVSEAPAPSGWALLWGGIKRSVTGYEYKPDKRHIDLKAVTAEFLGTLLLTFVGCGAATVHGAGTPITRLIIAFSFGMTVMAVAYAIGHHSGGHLNCAVTFSLVLGGAVSWNQGLANLVAQCFASIVACILLVIIHPCEMDLTTTLATNIPAPGFTDWQVILAEAMGTFLLCFTVWETAVTEKASSGKNACLVIGMSVFLAIQVLIHVDGCSINPNRSLGPALVSKLRGCSNYTEGGIAALWMMWVGPLIGALLAALSRLVFAPKEIFGTFMLCFTVWECAVTPVGTCGKNVCLAIGAAVFVNVLILLPVDGCSLNPNRSFGPAVVSALRGCDNYVSGGLEALWMMFLGPLLGAAAAAGLQWPLQPNKEVFEQTAECGGACES